MISRAVPVARDNAALIPYSFPNAGPIHDVGMFGERLFIAAMVDPPFCGDDTESRGRMVCRAHTCARIVASIDNFYKNRKKAVLPGLHGNAKPIQNQHR